MITDGNGNYLNANANYNGITRGTSEATATHWHFTTKGNNPSGTISTEYNGTTYYLRAVQSGSFLNRSYSLQLSTTSTASSWTNDNGTLRNSTYRQAYIQYNNNAFSAGTSGTKLTFPSRTESFPASVSFVTKETPTVELLEVQEEPTEISISEPMEITTGLTFRETQDQLYEGTTSTVRRSGYFPIRVAVDGESDYSASSPYKVSQKNTGYIIGGTYSAASQSGQGDIRVSRYGISEIGKSYANNRFSTIYTFNGSGTPVAINA